MFGIPMTASAAGLGLVAAGAAWGLTRRAFQDIEEPLGHAGRFAALAAGLLTAALVGAMLGLGCQETSDVVPTPFWRDGRAVFHAALIVLLVSATATDLKAYYITDSVTLPGILLGVAGATIAGDLQMVHLWVDWNQEIPQLAGPYRPEWLSTHPTDVRRAANLRTLLPEAMNYYKAAPVQLGMGEVLPFTMPTAQPQTEPPSNAASALDSPSTFLSSASFAAGTPRYKTIIPTPALPAMVDQQNDVEALAAIGLPRTMHETFRLPAAVGHLSPLTQGAFGRSGESNPPIDDGWRRANGRPLNQ